MINKIMLLSIFIAVAGVCAPSRASDVALGSRKFHKLTLVTDKMPSDCREFLDTDKTQAHIQEYITAHVGAFVEITASDDTPFLLLKVDCMKLEDTRGAGRVIGYSLGILVEFYRPFYEDIAYVFGATWSDMQLLYIPAESFTQMDFNEHLDLALEEFCHRWLDEHHELMNNDNLR